MSAPHYYFVIGVVPLPITAYIWITAFTDLLYKKRQTTILLIFLITGIVFEMVFFTILLIDHTLIGEVTSPVDAEYEFFVTAYQLFLVVMVLITGLLFARQSLKSASPEIRLKGKLLFVAFISFVLGSVLEILSDISIIILIVARLILISSSIEFYGGFILPKWMERLFLKEK